VNKDTKIDTAKLFSEKVAAKIWEQYFRRVNRFSRTLDPDHQKELKLEIQDHLYESFGHEEGESEAERLLGAIDKIGDPEEYIRPMVADRLLMSASRSLNPKSIFKGLYYNLFGGIKYFFVSLFYTMGYLTCFILWLMALAKPFVPDYVGLFVYQSGSFGFGLIGGPTAGREELLGYWIIPIGVTLGLLIYLGLTRLLRVFARSVKA
jgi:hypothetical protein